MGATRIELRLSPLTAEKSPIEQLQDQVKGSAEEKAGNTAFVSKNAKPLELNLTRFKPQDITIDWSFLYYGAGALIVLGLLLLILKRRKPVVAEPAEENKSIFDEKDKKETDGFDDVAAVPSVDQMRDLVSQSPEKVAAVLEQWLKEDESR